MIIIVVKMECLIGAAQSASAVAFQVMKEMEGNHAQVCLIYSELHGQQWFTNCRYQRVY